MKTTFSVIAQRLRQSPLRAAQCAAILLVVLGFTAAFASAAVASPLNAQGNPDLTQSVHEVPLPEPALIGPDAYTSLPMTPPDNPEVGDSWTWWVWTHSPPPPHFAQVTCTVRGKSDHCYVVVENSVWNVRVFQHDVDQMLARWEIATPADPNMGTYESDSTYFGDPPDRLDHDPRIYLCWFNFGLPSDGFFFWFDEYPDGYVPPYHSNECEVVYLNSNNGQDPGGEYMCSVTSHEFVHMIDWNHDDNEDLWADEGLCELSMFFYGRPDQISGFNSNADNPLTDFAGNWPDYIKVYLWTLYFYERYGGHPPILSLVAEPANGIAGYENVLDAYGYTANVSDVFADWAVANFLDDTSLADGRFGYVGEELPEFYVMGTYSTYPVVDQPRTVGHWATDYYRFQGLSGINALELGFDGTDANRFAVWGLALRGDGSTGIYRMTIDAATQSGTVTVPGLGDAADQVILVVSSVSSAGATNYVFRAAQGSADAPDIAGLESQPALRLVPASNPSWGDTQLLLAWQGSNQYPTVDIFDAQGRLVRTLLGSNAAPVAMNSSSTGANSGETRLVLSWDGRLASGLVAPQGTYYARARLGSASGGATIVRVR